MHPRALLEAASDLVGRVMTLDHPADAVVSRFFREHRALGPRERATLAETAYAVLRMRRRYEHLARSGTGPVSRRLAILGFRGDGAFLRSALDPRERDWLDACLQTAEADLPEPQRHNLPDWLAERLKQRLGESGFWALAEALMQPAPLDLRVNTLAGRREEVQAELAAEGIATAPTAWSPWGLRAQGKPALNKAAAFHRGALEVQDEGSQLLALLVQAGRGQMVVDFCAGAGGKTLALGAAMRNTGRLYAFDVSAHRLDAMKPRLARSGLSNVHPVVIAHERDDRVKRLSGKMDRVLVDAPCSGLGTLRRNPDLKWRQTPETVLELRQKQAAILASAARMVKPGGRLVYATCSLLDEENGAVADAFGDAHPDFVPLDAADCLTAAGVADADALSEPGPQATRLRLWPHLHATDGFFAAVWTRAA